MSKKKFPKEFDDDPRKIRDPVVWQRIKVMVDSEALDPHWCCNLYRMYKLGEISEVQREAGDAFEALTREYNQGIFSPTTFMTVNYAERLDQVKNDWRACIKVLGAKRHIIENLCCRDEMPSGDKAKVAIKHGLELLGAWFGFRKNKT